MGRTLKAARQALVDARCGMTLADEQKRNNLLEGLLMIAELPSYDPSTGSTVEQVMHHYEEARRIARKALNQYHNS